MNLSSGNSVAIVDNSNFYVGGVVTDLGADDLPRLQPYKEEKWFGIGWGGLFRKHPEWEKRSGS